MSSLPLQRPAPKPALPSPSRPAKTVIVGARGRMGAMFLARAKAAGLAVTGVDLPFSQQSLHSACAQVTLALICVPAAVFRSVTTQICPHLPPQTVLADITSVKEIPLRQMQEIWAGPVVGTHPLFGPQPAPQTDQPVVIVPGKNANARHIALASGFFTTLGCRVFAASAEEHDKAMACIQNMNFITSLAYFALLAEHEELLPFLTPSFRRRLDAAQKMLTEDARMFAGLFDANPHSAEAVRQYRRMLGLAAAGDIDLLCQRVRWWWTKDSPAMQKKW
ncbi:MAG: prephenate dehydrogenase/arogenate dehydrogenase family protein [Desulfovibrio sp.]|nr:prephenate dehydrogenase/arogenate dehydrogenase family protein [Desulfovibrio sp.]